VPIPSPMVVVGGGRMGEAIVSGLLSSGMLYPDGVVVVEPDIGRRRALEDAYGVTCTLDVVAASLGAAIVVLAVKPQVIDGVIETLAGALREPPTYPLVVSIAAGVSTARLEAILPEDTPVVRVMPNTPARVCEGMSLISAGSKCSEEHLDTALKLFGTLGDAVVVAEGLQDACTAVSGSGPAYVAIFIDALACAGVQHGLSHELAQRLALRTVGGTVELLKQTGMRPSELVDAVSSPGGTTIAAVETLEDAGFREAVADAVGAAVERSKELGS